MELGRSISGSSSGDLTVLVLSRDHGAFVSDCLQSIFSEFGGDMPVVLVDVGSKDDTMEVAKSEGNPLFANFKLLSVNRSLNSIGAMKVGLEYVQTNYILLISADDSLDDGYAKSVLRIFTEFDQPIVINSLLKVTNRKLEFLSTRKPKWTSDPRADFYRLLASNPGTAPGAVIPVFILQNQPLWKNAPDVIAEDLLIWWCLVDEVQFVSNLDGAVLYRQHGGNASGQNNSVQFAFTLGVAVKLSMSRAGNLREYSQVVKLLLRSVRHLRISRINSFIRGLRYEASWV